MAFSTTLRVCLSSALSEENDASPMVLATMILKTFGDIARLDVVQLEMTGTATVSYFDVRSGEMAFSHFGSALAELVPPADSDFRIVAADLNVVLGVGPDYLLSFGEVATVVAQGLELWVEFFDMRAAQQLLVAMPACRPVPYNQVAASTFQQCQPLVAPSMEAIQHELAQMAALDTSGSPVLRLPSPVGCHLSPAGEKAVPTPATPRASATDKLPAANTPKAEDKSPSSKAAGTPSSKDFTDLEVIPDKILSSQDMRTTVMLRSLPKSCSHDAVEALLEECGLRGRYTFFYMPYDRRRSTACGFAFVDFAAPEDVLLLWSSLEVRRRAQQAGDAATTSEDYLVPLASYARLQGREELEQHFRRSAAMHDTDERRRPQFYKEDSIVEGKSPKKAVPATPPGLDIPASRSSSMSCLDAVATPTNLSLSTAGVEPLYVQLPEDAEDADAKVNFYGADANEFVSNCALGA